ncbi:hypothetical protein BSF44_35170 [Pseudomonas sp. ACN8]|uniref:hypothetical protein n=1 Tax=Pseudomonas sp. ACN8 TaxID=1920428 RepID=UPI000BB386D1|nr:hypothetical protein [Pseudomonas sp. ACN8]PBJ21654.1 hypothetical protein BSF44_35170 [Pseudomonas sp. ACN8]
MQATYLKQQQAELLAFIFALCSDDPNQKLIGELGAFELMKELNESVLNHAVDCYSILKSKTETYTKEAIND